MMGSRKNTSARDSTGIAGISLAFTALVLLTSLLPALYDILMSVKEYTPFKGFFNSPNVGLANYQKFFNSFYFSKLLSNTIVQSLLFSLFLFLISVILGSIVVSLPSRSILGNVIITLALIPAFIPDVVYVSWFMNLQLQIKPFLMPNIAVWFIPLIRAMKYAGIPILMASIIYEIRGKKNYLLPLQAGACFALFSIMFITINDITISFLAVNPLIYEVIDSFNLFTYRSGLVNGEYSYAAAITVISRLLCLISVAIFFIPFKMLAKNLFGRNLLEKNFSGEHLSESNLTESNLSESTLTSEATINASSENQPSVNYWKQLLPTATAISIVIVLILAALPLMIKNINIFDSKAISMVFQNSDALSSFPLYLFISLLAASANVGLFAILAYPIVCGRKILRRISIGLMLLIAISVSAPISVGTYILFRSLGMINTTYGVLLPLIFPTAGVWAFVAIANSQGVPENMEYIRAISKPSIALILVQMVYNLNNFLPSLIYITDRKLFSPALMYRELALVGGEAVRQLPQYDAMIFWYGVILSIIPVGILVVLRTRLTKTSLFSILGMAQRK